MRSCGGRSTATVHFDFLFGVPQGAGGSSGGDGGVPAVDIPPVVFNERSSPRKGKGKSSNGQPAVVPESGSATSKKGNGKRGGSLRTQPNG